MAINRFQMHFIFAKSEKPLIGAQPLPIASPRGRSGDHAAAFGLDSARDMKVERQLHPQRQTLSVIKALPLHVPGFDPQCGAQSSDLTFSATASAVMPNFS
ncbi:MULTISPECIES: hypothetical protein [unclassified Roseovarius]|uniref:hypothetical protein n=1 Tax=unclassified Roseovarius TaxID=2614913 RepID=UPI00273E0CA7|nr:MULTISPECIES: hypothetical protein [unclassified Roseovarius]